MSNGRRELILTQPLKERGLRYRVVDRETGKELCVADIKVSSTKTIIHAKKVMGGEITWFEIRQEEDINTIYKIMDEKLKEIGIIEVSNKSPFMPELKLKIGDKVFKAKGAPHAVSFEVFSPEGFLVLTVDKNMLALDDTFNIVLTPKIDIRYALALALAIDDVFFH